MAEQEQTQPAPKKIAEIEEKAYETEKIVDYSKNLYAEKKMSSAKQSNNDFDIVTDGLEADD